jgi:peptidyl-tRNA hydrolase, PTH1 family
LVDPGTSLIVGLGNPGQEYAETRHNAGFRFLGAVMKVTSTQLRAQPRFGADIARANIGDVEVWLLAPTNFMNRSGDAVARFAQYYKISPDRILVVYDELDLPPGAVRLKFGGGDAGHNGLHDVIEKLGTADFARLRIGVGRPAVSGQGAAHVLKRASAAEQALIDGAIERAVAQLPDIVRGQHQKVMNALHTDAPS